MRLIVFTDLDGTLLDHSTYSFDPALPAIRRLKELSVPLVLASSKTALEISRLHQQLDLGSTPAIVENGAGLYNPHEGTQSGDGEYQQIREVLAALPTSLRNSYKGFGDMCLQEIVETTGLSADAALLARQRQFTEPGIWNGNGGDLELFTSSLADQGIRARRGGRFLTLSLGRTKADAMDHVTQMLGADRTVALGDAPNDLEMIEAATYGVIVKNGHGKPLPFLAGEKTGQIRRTEFEGPTGWNRAVLDILEELGLTQENNDNG